MGSQAIITAEDQLKAMREGYSQKLELKIGGLRVPCRLLPAQEEATVMANAKTGLKVPNEDQRPLFQSLAVMKAILAAACLIDSTPHLADSFLDAITNPELEQLYDQYMTLVHTVNPAFEKMSAEQIAGLVEGVKKKERTSKDCFTWQLAEIGRYFLDEILPRVREVGP